MIVKQEVQIVFLCVLVKTLLYERNLSWCLCSFQSLVSLFHWACVATVC